MRARGRDDVQGVARGRGFGNGIESRHLVSSGNPVRGIGDCVVHAGELYLVRCGQLRINARVFLAQGTDAKHGHGWY
jgi:hypothetical protein